MKIENLQLKFGNWEKLTNAYDISDVNLVIVHGKTNEFENDEHFYYLKKRYPDAEIIGCSSDELVLKNNIPNSEMVACAISFNSSRIVLKSISGTDDNDASDLSYNLIKKFDSNGLKHIFLLADGLKFNGSDIVKGLNKSIDIPKTGGLAADGTRVEKSLVMANAPASQNIIAAIGFYGDKLTIKSSSVGGWKEFGTPRIVTKSSKNTLYELNGEPIIEYYKRYFGSGYDFIKDIAFKFPFGIKKYDLDEPIIRTAIRINYDDNSVTTSGDIPEGYIAQIMKPDIDMLIDGAGEAAKIAQVDSRALSLGLVTSCEGRRSVLRQLVQDEVEKVATTLGDNVNLVGFYSYGEISPYQNGINKTLFHNQTMTITVVSEEIE